MLTRSTKQKLAAGAVFPLLLALLGLLCFGNVRAGAPAAASATVPTNAASPGAAAGQSQEDQDLAVDKQHLRKIYDALQAYNKKYGKLPDWLSDLFPEFLTDGNVLMSPVELRTGRSVLWGYSDPKMTTSYVYEFSQADAKTTDEQGKELTLRDKKMIQMEEYGPVTPLLRCHLHDPILNLTYSGDIYESGLFWETDPNTRALMQRLGPGPGPKDSKKMRLTVVDADDQKPVQGAEVEVSRLIVMSFPLPPKRLTTDAHGQCEINLVSKNPQSLTLRISHSDRAFCRSEWTSGNIPAEWTAQLHKAIAIGGLVRDSTGKPIAGAVVSINTMKTNESGELAEVELDSATTDASGKWTNHSVPVDFTAIRFNISHPEFRPVTYEASASSSAGEGEVSRASLLAGQAVMEMKSSDISGLVRATNGQPAAGIAVRVVGVFGPGTSVTETDAHGKFDLKSNSPQFPSPNRTACVVVRDEAHNLAAAQDLDEDAGPLDLTLAPAFSLAGRAECNGKPLTNAFATLIFWAGRGGTHLTGLSHETNAPGHFEITALPAGRKYGILVSAPGYGQKSIYDVGASDAGRVELDPVELLPANLKLAGQVLDADDKPVSGVHVNLQGEGQPFANVQTDAEGRFVFDKVCEGTARVSANSSRSYGSVSAEGGETNVVLRLGQNYNTAAPAESKAHRLKGVITNPDGSPATGAQVAVLPQDNNASAVTSKTDGTYNLAWSLPPWQQSAGARVLLIARDRARNLAASAEVSDEISNLNAQLKPALILEGKVENAEGAPLPRAEVGVWLKIGNSLDQMDERTVTIDAEGKYQIKTLPPEEKYTVFASAKGYGRVERQIENGAATNRIELDPIQLDRANHVVAGQVLNENEKPVAGVNIFVNGAGQPSENATTDTKGRFHFQVCEGSLRLFANSQGGFAQGTAQADDTNIVLIIRSRMGMPRQASARTVLKGRPLPDLTSVQLANDSAPAGKPVLLCLFDAGQRPSRHLVHLLDEQATALSQKNICLVGVQSAMTGDDVFNGWKSANPVSFPVGRATEKIKESKWAADPPALPWLILADANHRVIAEGFPLDELDAQIQKLPKEAPIAVPPSTNVGTNTAAETVKCAGTVTDAAGHPLAGATVEYWRYEGNPFMANFPPVKQQIITEADGAFAFQVSSSTGLLLAHKVGLAPAWIDLNGPFGSVANTEEHLALTPPAALAGLVVDEADKPVPNAQVFVSIATGEISGENESERVNFISGRPARDAFVARTDAAGHFRIANFPTNASAVLVAEAAGKALREDMQSFSGFNSLPWHAGQNDIKLVTEAAGAIEGKIVVEGNQQAPPLARLTAQRAGPGALSSRDPVPSRADGSFQFHDLAPGSYYIHAAFGTNAIPEWVADAVVVPVEAGQTTRGIKVTASRGGFLEAAVFGAEDRKPLARVTVNAYKENYQFAGASDSNGLALLRLPPGSYQVMASSPAISGSQSRASVEADKTNRVELEIAAPKKITGIVRQPDGQPAAGVLAQVMGGFGRFGPGRSSAKTDAAGKFELEWNQNQFMQMRSVPCILVRDEKHNLAVAQDLDEDTGPLDLKLVPGLTLAGRVECNGKLLTNATATLMFWTGNRGMNLPGLGSATHAPGRFEITALPPGRKYGVHVSAPGYGQYTINNIDTSAEGKRVELDPVELKLANLKLAGQVLDADDKPVPSVNVMLYGEGQPNANATTDQKGRFHFEHVCEGQAQIQANSQNSFGNVSAEGGETNVVLKLGQQMGNAMPGSKSHKVQGTVTDPDGKPAPGAELTVFPSSFGNPQWSKAAANGAYHLTWSLQPWQAQQSGGTALLVARDRARNLAATEDLPEDATNLDIKLKPALTVAGLVRKPDDSPLAGAQISVLLKAANSFDQLSDQQSVCDAKGRYEIKCLPAEGHYLLFASAKDHGQNQQQFQGDAETNLMELPPFVLNPADQVLAGQVLDEKDKPVSGAMVQLNGQGQPSDNVSTDSKGRFHFKVCQGHVNLFANSPQGGGFAQAGAEAGDTNVVINLSSQPGTRMFRQAPARAALKGKALPALAAAHLADGSLADGKPVVLCLFDAGQRPSRHILRVLDEQAGALRQKNVCLLGIQATVTSDDIFNGWKTASPVSFPIGRVTETNNESKWEREAPALPWLILTDASHQVVSEGFPVEQLAAELEKLPK